MKMKYKTTKTLTEPVINELLELADKGNLIPEEIVELAKNKENPLHRFFEWDDRIASDQWRLHQARMLINEVKVVIDGKEYFAFENVGVSKEDGGKFREYKPIVEILNNAKLRKQLLKSALSHLSYWEKQYAKFEELQPIIQTVKEVRVKIENEDRTENKPETIETW